MKLQPGEYVYLRDPEDLSNKELITAPVVWSANTQLTIKVESFRMALLDQEDLLIFFTQDRVFMQQVATIVAVGEDAASDHSAADDPDHESPDTTADDGVILVTLEPEGRPVSAENRECFRIRSYTEIFATINDNISGRLADISQTGFAAVCDADLPEGAIVRVSLYKDDVSVCGPARVQSKRQTSKGHYRYGLLCVERTMQQDCGRVAMMVQRENLRRRSFAR